MRPHRSGRFRSAADKGVTAALSESAVRRQKGNAPSPRPPGETGAERDVRNARGEGCGRGFCLGKRGKMLKKIVILREGRKSLRNFENPLNSRILRKSIINFARKYNSFRRFLEYLAEKGGIVRSARALYNCLCTKAEPERSAEDCAGADANERGF